ncbi:MAG: 50S ribosomal protein L23 [Deltaproteobacteria bacterium]|nr:50S ribosomal protein L23 [Deltaproteobacteria bacterium]
MSSVKNNVCDILRRPRITEKAAGYGADGGSFVVFDVHSQANKVEIRAAVEKIFGVKVASVRTMNAQGKVKRVRNKMGRRAGIKKAYVKLQPGSTINIIEGL